MKLACSPARGGINKKTRYFFEKQVFNYFKKNIEEENVLNQNVFDDSLNSVHQKRFTILSTANHNHFELVPFREL